MDGERALIYARSRHAEGEEGGDFARSRRQQDILTALKNKMIRPFSWVTPGRITRLSRVLDEATDMDMNLAEALTLGKQFVRFSGTEVKKISFEDKLITPPSYVYGRYVLVPEDSWEDIHSFIKTQLER